MNTTTEVREGKNGGGGRGGWEWIYKKIKE